MTKAWGEKRADITRLYIDENKTLNEVKTIMEQHHNFKASTRSYRQQFDKWGLAKYNCKKRMARRRGQDTSGHQLHHQSAGQSRYAEVVGGGEGAVEGSMASDSTIADLDAYCQSMSPQSCSSSLSSESAVGGGFVDDMMEVTGTTAGSHTPDTSYARNWPPQLSYGVGARQQQKQQQQQRRRRRRQQQQKQQHTQQPQHRQRRRSSCDQQGMSQSPYRTLPSPPAEYDGASYHSLFANYEAGMSPRPIRPQAYPILHPGPQRPESYSHQQPPPQYQYRQGRQQQPQPRSQVYSPAPLMRELCESVLYHGGVECAAVHQPGPQQ
ncbi:hypothetical protein LX36DRAFT_696849 [Colletotrichum falcatum]|nr:hypothetical protein LX36DRAFT_696849 [Colletotrichum falcatum]